MNFSDTVIQDLRYGLRMLRKNPGFTAVVVLTLALGIGATSAIFSVISAVILEPLPFPQSHRLMAVFETKVSRALTRETLSPANFLDFQRQNRVFSAIAAYMRGPAALTGRGDPTMIREVTASPDLFSVLGVSPSLGRTFLREEGARGHDHTVILSHALWQSRFGGDTNVVGQTVMLDGEQYVIVGVMPAGFQFPLSGSDVWIPLSFGANVSSQRGGHYLSAVARLRPGATIAQAQTELQTIATRLAADYPKTNTGQGAFVTDLQNALVGDVQPALLILLVAAALVVLIACANIASLLLARATDRDHEVAIRSATGAAPRRLIRQLLTESLVLSCLGAIAGLVLANWGVHVILARGPQDIPRLHTIHLDVRVLAFTAAVAILASLVFGLFPALRTASTDVQRLLKSGTRAVGREGSQWFLSSLVTSEVALSLILLVGAGLLIRSFLRLQSVDPGFRPANLLSFNLSLPEIRYSNGDRTALFFDNLLQRLEVLPGVQSAAVVAPRPLSGDEYSSSFTVKGHPVTPGEEESAAVRVVSPRYFTTMQIPLLRGRLFEPTDRRDAPPVVLISRAAEKRFFPQGDAIGQQVKFGASVGYDKVGGEIVGVVGDVHDSGVDSEPPPDAYVLASQAGLTQMSVVVRTAGDPLSISQPVQEAVHGLDKDLPIEGVTTMEEVLAESLGQRHFYMLLLALFAFVALSLAAVGVYGVMSYAVSRRTRELGIRLALGAQHRQVFAMLLVQVSQLVLAGLAIGLAATFLTSRVLAGMLFGVSSTDVATLTVVIAVLSIVAFVASYIPARRVLRVDPLISLRYE